MPQNVNVCEVDLSGSTIQSEEGGRQGVPTQVLTSL